MRADETENRVRTIPLGADLGADPEADLDTNPVEPNIESPAEAAVPASALSRRRLVVAAVVVVGTLVALGAFGSLGERAAPDLRSAAAAGPHLGDDATLVLAARAEPDGWAITWTPLPGSQPTGAIGAIPAPSSPIARAPALDAGEEWLASPRCVSTDCDLNVVRAGGGSAQAMSTVSASDFIWHSLDPGRLAWIEESGESGILRTASVDIDSGFAIDPMRVDVALEARLVLWDDRGFVIDSGGATVLDSAGAPGWTADGSTLDASSLLVVLERADGGWSALDRTDGTVVITSSPMDQAILVDRSRTDDEASSVDPDGNRNTFTIEASDPSRPDPGSSFRQVTIGSRMGTEYRVLRDPNGERFTVHLTQPEPVATGRELP